MTDVDSRLRELARAEDTPAPAGFDERLRARLETLPEKGRRPRGVKLALIAACVCIAVVGTTVAVSPALREQLAVFLGSFSDYVQPVDADSAVWDGIQLTPVSAIMDNHVLRVYVEAKDLKGDRLAPMAAESIESTGYIADASTMIKRDEPVTYTTEHRCLSYDERTGIALLEFMFVGDFSGVSGELDFNLYVDALYPEGWSPWDQGIANPDQSAETNWCTWTLPLTVERLDIDTFQLDQTIGTDAQFQLHTLELSAANAALIYTIQEATKPADPIPSHFTVYLADGSTVQGDAKGGSGTPNNWVREEGENYVHGYLDGETEYTTWVISFTFDDPLDMENAVGVSIDHWYIPLNADGTAGAGYWKYK